MNLASKKEVEGSFLFWLNWYQQAGSESINLRIYKGALLLPEMMSGKNMVIFLRVVIFKHIEILNYKALHSFTLNVALEEKTLKHLLGPFFGLLALVC